MSQEFYAARVTAFRPGELTGASTYPIGADAIGAPPQLPFETEATAVFRASDSGYRTEVVSGDVRVYPPVLERAVDLDRQITLSPLSAAASLSWGSLRLVNADSRWDGISTVFSADGRQVDLLHGRRSYDLARGLWQDPPEASLRLLFRGLAGAWNLSEDALVIPLRDASYWLQQRYQQSVYGGTGGLDGDEDLAGQSIPRVRGGTPAAPLRHVTPVLVDAVNRIYQYSDGPGTVVQLYENAAAGFSYGGNTSDLYSGSTAPGGYRTDNARGLFQLGSVAVGRITADVTGAFPAAGALTEARDIARYLLTEDMGMDPALLDLASFAALPSGATSGWCWESGDESTGADAVSMLLRGLGAKLLPGRDGRLRAYALRALAATAIPTAELGPAEIVSLAPVSLGEPLDPPAYRWRIGYARMHTVQTSGVSALLPDDQRRAVATAWPLAYWISPDVQAAYIAPSDPEIVETALLIPDQAIALANAIGALWSRRRRLYAVELPVEIGMTLDIGAVIRLTYPYGDLRGGVLGQITGDQLRGQDGMITVRVLV